MYWILVPLLLSGLALAGLVAVLRAGFRVPRRAHRGDPGDQGLEFSAVSVPTVGGRRIFGWWMPGDQGERTVVLIHGWGGNAESMLPVAAPMRRAGLGVLLIDSRGHGRSDADGPSSLPRFAEDVGAAIDWLQRECGLRPNEIALVGHSIGGASVLLEASRRAGLAAVVSIASFAHPGWVMRRHLKSTRVPDFLIAPAIRYAEWRIGERLDDIAPLATVGRIDAPVLLIHGIGDETIPISDAHAIMRLAGAGEAIELVEVETDEHKARRVVVGLENRLLSFLRGRRNSDNPIA